VTIRHLPSGRRRTGLRAVFALFLASAALHAASPAATVTSLSLSQTSIVAGDVVALTATVSAGGQPVTSGSVVFMDGNRTLGSAQVIISGLTAGSVILKTSSFAIGSNSLTALYSGAPNAVQPTSASASTPIILTVTGTLSSLVSLSAFPASGHQGIYDLTATVYGFGPPAPSGTVEFSTSPGNAMLGTAPLLPSKFGFAPVQSYNPPNPSVGSAVVVADFNLDGILDVAVGNSLYLGDPNHPGQLLLSSNMNNSIGGFAVLAGDFNSDGVLDLIVCCGSFDSEFLVPGDPSHPGQFLPYTLQFDASIVAVADLNGDGILDLVALSHVAADSIDVVGSTIEVFLGDPSHPGQFLQPAKYDPVPASNLMLSAPTGLAIGDFNGDGILDLAVSNSATPSSCTSTACIPNPLDSSIGILLGDPAHPGQFLAVTTFPAPYPNSPVTADFNHDGILDLATADGTDGVVSVLLGDPSHRGQFLTAVKYQFQPLTNAAQSPSLVVADFNGDGLTDLAVSGGTDYGAPASGVLLNNPAAAGTFLPLQPVAGKLRFLTIGDMNGDTLPDLVGAIQDSGILISLGVLLNSQTATAQSLDVSPGTASNNTFTASYSGDAHYHSGNSPATEAYHILTTTQLTASANQTTPKSFFNQISFTAVVKAGTQVPAGDVSFYEGTKVLCTATLDTLGQATCFPSIDFGIGGHSVFAAYAGQAPFLPSTSSTLNVVITPDTPQGTLTASPDPILIAPGAQFGVTTLQWNAPTAQTVEIHVGTPSGPAFAGGGSTGSATTGVWVTDGMVFCLQDTTGGKPLTGDNTLAVLVVHVNEQLLISASPNPIPVPPGSTLGATTIQWNVPNSGEWFPTSASSVEVHIGSPTGPIFAAGGNTGSATTGEWVTDGMVFYLQDVTSGKPLTAANTIATVVAHLVQQSASFTADPNPFVSFDSGVTTLSWAAPPATSVEIHVSSPDGPLLAAGGSAGSVITGPWVTNGMVFYLQDVTGGKPLTADNTLALVVIHTGLPAYFSASPNPVPNLSTDGSGQQFLSTALQWSAPTATKVEIHYLRPDGPVLTTGGPSGSVQTGQISFDPSSPGVAFYLQDASNGNPPSINSTIGMVLVQVQDPTAPFFTGAPNPAHGDSNGLAVITLQWKAPSASTVQVHIGSPAGPLLVQGTSAGYAATGNWVTNGMLFYLQDVTGGKPLTVDNTLAIFAARVN
jgi:hypothetical protein